LEKQLTDFAFVHGGGQGGWVWAETIAALRLQAGEKLGKLLALDAPGCGAKRGRATDALTYADLAAELVAEIETAGLRQVVLVGHSQGGQAIAMMLKLRPDLFARVVYVSCSIPLPGQNVLQMMGSGERGSHPDEVGWPFDPKLHSVASRFSLMFCNDMDAAEAAAFAAKLGPDAWPAQTYAFSDWPYDALQAVPASYVVCLRDNILPVAWQEMFAGRFNAGRLARIDAGHQAMTTRPQALAELLLRDIAQ
jgi:pimeloyl-ACP methyl ester carboxylesterase